MIYLISFLYTLFIGILSQNYHLEEDNQMLDLGIAYNWLAILQVIEDALIDNDQLSPPDLV